MPDLITQADPILKTSAVPSEAVGFAVVGANFGAGIARRLSRRNPFVRLVGICDRNVSLAERLAGELSVPVFSSIESLLENADVEAVGLFTPPVGRAALVQSILEAGRHVMTTKPFEMNLEAARSVVALAQARGLALHLNSPAPVPSEDMQCIEAWMSDFDLGRPIAMHAATWASYRENYTGTWYDDPVLCPAAPITRLGVYFLSDFAMLLGEPESVHVMHSRIFTGRPTADNAQITIRFANGAMASIFASFCVTDGQPWRDEVRLSFERGTIRRWVERTGSPDMADDHAVAEVTVSGREGARFKTAPGAFAGWYNWPAFHGAIRGTQNVPLCDSARLLYGVRLLDALRRSALSGLPEPVAR